MTATNQADEARPLDPATWPHTRSFLAILEESGVETARAQFLLTHAEAETVCAWAKENPNLRGTVIILEDDPETEDFRPSDPGSSPAGCIGGSAPPSAAAAANYAEAETKARRLVAMLAYARGCRLETMLDILTLDPALTQIKASVAIEAMIAFAAGENPHLPMNIEKLIEAAR